LAQGSFYIYLTDLFRKIIFHPIVKDHLFFKTICTCLGRLHHSYYFRVAASRSRVFIAETRNCFLCHSLYLFYLISLCTVIFLRIGLYFFNSNLPVVFFLFLVVIYLDVPGIPLSLCSVHSRITCTLLPFAFFPIAAISYSL